MEAFLKPLTAFLGNSVFCLRHFFLGILEIMNCSSCKRAHTHKHRKSDICVKCNFDEWKTNMTMKCKTESLKMHQHEIN